MTWEEYVKTCKALDIEPDKDHYHSIVQEERYQAMLETLPLLEREEAIKCHEYAKRVEYGIYDDSDL